MQGLLARSINSARIGAVAGLLLVGCGARGSAPTRADATPDPEAVSRFYAGKTITIVVGYAPGGGYDTAARLISRHLGKHIPGNPNIIVENMEGAGSLIAANHLYNVAKPDGLTLGIIGELQVLNQLTSVEGVQFDAQKYSWLGALQKTNVACTIRVDSAYKTPADLFRKDLPPVVLAASGPGADTYDFPRTLAGALGANIKLVPGYAGSGPMRLAVESKEAEGMCWAYESVLATAQHWLDSGLVTVLVYQAPARDTRLEGRFPGARLAEDLAPDDAAKRLIRAATAPSQFAKPLIGPPGLPPQRLAALQEAFASAVKDPALLEDAEKARVEVDATSGPEAMRVVAEILALAPDLTRRLTEIRK